MRMWEWMARPLSKRITRCFPTGLTSVTVHPARRFKRSGRATRTCLPSRPSRRVSAVRQMVSPSGTRLYSWSKKTGAAAANMAMACRARTSIACLGARGSHVIAKKAMTGTWPAIRSCQRCAAVPSSASRAVPKNAICPRTMTSATSDIAGGTSALGRPSVDKLSCHLVFRQINDLCLADLIDALAPVAFEDLHPLVELGARVVEVRFHALPERAVIVIVIFPELTHHTQRGAEQLVHALVHDLPTIGRCVDETVEQKDAVPNVPALIPRKQADSVEQPRQLAIGLERLAEPVIAGLGENALDHHVVGHRRPDLRFDGLIGLERVEGGRQVDQEELLVDRGQVALQVSTCNRDLVEPAPEKLDVLGLLPQE